MEKENPSKIAERVWDNYTKSGKTFSHSLSSGQFKYTDKIIEISILAMNQCPKNKDNEWNPRKSQFIESFVNIWNNK